ncbi:hypothetical protein AX15_006138 [Amanita polypyramis BW_CC]|nr:hypothetical protein AX15_006138 [Amanita polypyramis BW_CC]
MNLLAADGETWRRHRRVNGPAFNNNLYDRVFDESVTLYHSMVMAEKWEDSNEVHLPAFHDLTYKFALFIIGKCGFGISFNWSSPDKAEDGLMSVQEAVGLMAKNMLIGLLPWLMLLPFGKFRRIRVAYQELTKFMNVKVAQRKVMVQNSKADGLELESDIFTMLVQANEDEAAKHKLDDQELIGNVYIMLTAGHETTASSLATTIGLMALHTDIQDDVFEQIDAVIGCNRDPTFDDYPKLNKVLAVFLEATRMFTPAYVFLRQAAEDTVLDVQNPVNQGGFTRFPIKKGTMVVADMIGLQYNSRYYDEPEKFKPSRWYGMENEWEKLTAFSIGQRACIGRKFATTEAVAFLTMLLRGWRVEPLLRPGEIKDDWSKRVFDIKTLEFSMRIQDVSVKLIRRQPSSLGS